MWVKDELDRIIPKEDISRMSPANIENLLKYTYRNAEGNYIFCWDLTRYVNHSYHPNSMLTPFGFEIAIVDIKVGDEVTNDYGTLNIIEPFECANGPHEEREMVCPDDLSRMHDKWDAQVEDAFKELQSVAQPLSKFLTQKQVEEITQVKSGQAPIPSLINNLYRPENCHHC
jgi:hypothetical protein